MTAQATAGGDRNAAVMDYVMHHVMDSHHWVLPFLPEIPLPPWLSLHGLMLLIAAFFLILLFSLVRPRKDGRAGRLTNALEALVQFVRDQISIASLGEEDGRRLAPLFCSFFFFILTLNLMGLIPLFATATGNINVAAGLALVTLSFMIFGAIYRNGPVAFLRAFLPHGVPWPILVLLGPIEFVGMFIKAFAMTIRLFANMFSGHVVILTLIGLVVMFGAPGLPALALALGVCILEIMVSFLQAYVFTLLSAMFIAQVHHPEH